MLNYILPHCHNNLDMYKLLANQYNDQYIKPHEFKFYHYFASAYVLLYLAVVTQQPNFEQLKEEYSKMNIEQIVKSHNIALKNYPNAQKNPLPLTEDEITERRQKFELFAQHLQKLASENQLLHSVVRADLYGQFR